jgi:hypothetical protein
MKPVLRILRRKLNNKELSQVVTSHYFSRLYYGSEIWYHPLKKCVKDRLKQLHYYPLRLLTFDFQKALSYKKLSELCKRASPFDYNNYKVAKTLIAIVNSTSPFFLFHVLLSQAVMENRRPHEPWFLDMSRSRIGRQSLVNRSNLISKRINFKWLDVELSRDTIRTKLKRAFFHPSTLA